MTLARRSGRPQILFIHRSLGGQFEFFGGWLAQQGWDVTFACCTDNLGAHDLPGIRVVGFEMKVVDIPEGDYRHALGFAAANALGVAELLYRMRNVEGYDPDVVMAHVGWGVGLCVKQIWPETAYIAYHEWYYTNRDWDKAGKPEYPATLGQMAADRMRNLPITAEFDLADANWCPTRFQASRFPPVLRRLISVVPDGVDCEAHRPDPEAAIDFDWLRIPSGEKILTYATRGMEPTRGFPQFMRGLKDLQKRRDDFHTVILANESVSYGGKLGAGDSWRLRMLDELDLDQRKLHIFGMRTRPQYRRVLQASSVHCYFSEPFVTSWSLSDALATGCMVIGSDTAPVRELIEDMRTGILVDMNDPEEIADMIEWCFDHPQDATEIRARARGEMVREYDSRKIFPEKEELLRGIAGLPASGNVDFAGRDK